MVDEQRGPVVASGTLRVQGYPTPHERHGRQRGQAVKAAQHPKGLAFTAWHRWRTLANKEGWGWCATAGARRAAPCRLLGWLPGDAPASRGKGRGTGTAPPRTSTPSAGGGGSPLGGRTGHLPARAKGAQAPGPTGWAGANSTDRAQRLDRTLCGFGAADTALANGCSACGLAQVRHAARAGQERSEGARHNGGLVNPPGREGLRPQR